MNTQDLCRLADERGHTITEAELDKWLAALAAHGLAECDGGDWRLTAKGVKRFSRAGELVSDDIVDLVEATP